MGPKVLVVEDDESIRELVSAALATEGYEVRSAAEGRSALRELERFPAAVILLDMRMPVMDGWEFLRRYRPASGRARTIVFAASQQALESARELGADAIVEKPFELDDLLDLVRRYAGA